MTGSDAGVLQALRAGVFGVERGGQRQVAAAEIEAAQGEVTRSSPERGG